jgi:hypothetical protein
MSSAFSQISLLAARAISVITAVGVGAEAMLLGQPGRLFHAADFAQELVDVGQCPCR